MQQQDTSMVKTSFVILPGQTEGVPLQFSGNDNIANEDAAASECVLGGKTDERH